MSTLEEPGADCAVLSTEFGSTEFNDLPEIEDSVTGSMSGNRLSVLIGNVQMEWLGRNSCDQSVAAARLIYEALGAKENMGHTESSHNHCEFVSKEEPVLEAFIKKFLLGEDVSTDYWTVAHDFEQEKWAGWSVPDLTE